MKSIAVFILFFLAACDVKIKHFDKYQKVPLLELENMPSKEQIKHALSRVLITQTEPANDDIRKSNAHNLIKNDIIELLQEGKFANVVERKEGSAVTKEVKIAELEGKGSGGIASVDYILEVDVTNVTFSRQNIRQPGMVITSGVTGLANTDVYQYTSTVEGVIKIYQLPKMNIVKTIDLRGIYIESEQSTAGGTTVATRGIAVQTSDTILSKEYDSNITYRAIKNAVYNATPELKNFFKKHGYVLEKRAYKKNNIFALNIGSESGVNSQDKIAISRKKEIQNPLTEETEEVSEEICKGTISDKVFQNRSWAVFEKKCQSKIYLGDRAEILY